MEALEVDGARVFTPRLYSDRRGTFLNNFVMPTWEPIWLVLCALRRPTAECPAVGSSGESTSPKFPPGQAKYVTCVQGAILWTLSSTFGSVRPVTRWAAVQLDDEGRRAVFLAEGLGHAFMVAGPPPSS